MSDQQSGQQQDGFGVDEPAKLLRIAAMANELLSEIRGLEPDEGGRRRFREIHDRSMRELKDVLGPELTEEIEAVTVPFEDEAPSASELRVAQAQLAGWLDGLLRGVQAAFMAQQMQSQRQLQELQQQSRRAMPQGAGPGQYL